MKLREHCEERRLLFGEEFAQVHEWLDEHFATLGARHRRKRHNLAGIGQVRQRWGDLAADVTRRHVIDDLREEGLVDGNRLPVDEADYVRMGLF